MFKFKKMVFGLTLISSIAVASVASAVTVTNSGFEIPAQNHLGGWQHSNAVTAVNENGNWLAQLSSLGSAVTLTHELTSLVVGQSYIVSFSAAVANLVAGRLPSASVNMGVGQGSVQVIDLSSLTSALSTVQVTLTAISDHLTFRFDATSGGNNLSSASFLKIDNVSVTAVPGPIAGAGIPMLLAGLGWLGRRRLLGV